MRDAFLVFLMVITGVALAGVPVTLRWGFGSGDGDDALVSLVGAVILLGMAAFLLLVVGHAVGMSVPGLGR